MKINERFEPESGQSERINQYRDLVPLRLRTPEFLEAWDEWVENRIELGKKYRWPITELSFVKALKKCERWGVQRSIAAIDHSIEYGYRGLFESHHAQSTSQFYDPNDAPGTEYYVDSLGRRRIKR